MKNFFFERYDPYDPSRCFKNRIISTHVREKGGSSSGSGKVDYPDHMKTFHAAYIGSGSTYSLTTAWNAAVAAAPYAAEVSNPTYAPATDFAEAEDEIVLSKAPLTWLVDPSGSGWTTILTAIKSRWEFIGPTQAAGLTTSLVAEMEDQLDNVILPKFRRGMQDIGAVNSSAFVIGESLLRSQALKQVTDKAGEVQTKLLMQYNEMVFKDHQMCVDWHVKRVQLYSDYAKLFAEFKRVLVVGQMEWAKHVLETNVHSALWKLELTKYVNDAFGAIHGAPSTVNTTSQKSQLGSAIGGGISGAATGAAIGSVVPGIGTAVGAVAGGLLGIGSSFL